MLTRGSTPVFSLFQFHEFQTIGSMWHINIYIIYYKNKPVKYYIHSQKSKEQAKQARHRKQALS